MSVSGTIVLVLSRCADATVINHKRDTASRRSVVFYEVIIRVCNPYHCMNLCYHQLQQKKKKRKADDESSSEEEFGL